ncbi:superoxide dismutase family protein [Variovorax sp. KK3]|uniref:superoxide dismutase family protein n=1 Tax=Variovorax sp. KK3 TaxID=1855728 RepID=UPI0021177D47|nr:superoxide dismutase family protein [Variovorax sp. KK3]
MKLHFVLSSFAVALLSACVGIQNQLPADSAGSAPASAAPVASARLTTPSGQPAGTVNFAPTAGKGVELVADARGLAPGPHGFHVHAQGACAPGSDPTTGRIVDFGAAGGHFDPGGSRNHGRPGDDKAQSHAGELPALQAGADGNARLRYVNHNLSLDRGATSVIGRTVVVHADPDDYTSDPAGNSGARILCGVIEMNAPSMVKGRATLEGSHVFPEGIAIDPRSGTAFVGSSSNGDLFRIERGAAKAELVQVGGAVGRQGAFGMKFDAMGRLWVAGGPNGTLAAVDVGNGTTLAVVKAPQDRPRFLNDLVIAQDGTAYVTDSFQPVIYRMRTTAGAPASLEPWLDLAQTPIRYLPNQINLNGIVASADGRHLLSIQLATGQLWRIDTQSKAVTQVRIDGGELRDGDGLVLTGANELYVVRNAHHELVRVRLSADWSSGRIEQRLTDSRLRYPTTAAVSSGGLMVVNGQLDRQKNPPVLLPFDVVTMELPR